MASACRKPDIPIFDTDITHRWNVFRRDFEHYVTIAHPAIAPAVKASLLLNLAGPEALERSESFVYGLNENAQDPARDRKVLGDIYSASHYGATSKALNLAAALVTIAIVITVFGLVVGGVIHLHPR